MHLIKRLKNLYQSLNALSTLNDIAVDSKIRANQLLVDALTLRSPLISKRISESTELIVSFTTYNKRIHDVHLVIESIAQQTVKPNRLILWLDEDEFSLNSIPVILHNQIARGLEIKFCPNYKSYKKLIPTLKHFPKANIITIDDDVLYPHDMIEILYKEHELYPNHIIGHRAHKMKLTHGGDIMRYRDWDYDIREESIGNDIFLTGVGGIFYPSNSLSKTTLDYQVFMDLCFYADDVWFKAMALLNGVECKKVKDERDFFSRFLLLPSSQDGALLDVNVIENDKQIEKVFNKYKLISKLLT